MMFKSDLFLVLMFHKISEDTRDGLTITIDDFNQYVDFFKKKNFEFLSGVEVVKILRKERALPVGPSVFFTFDDGYAETFKLIDQNYSVQDVPLTCFVPVQHVGGTNKWDQQEEPLLGWSELSLLAEKEIVDFALHSYSHENYKDLPLEQIKTDIENCAKDWKGKKNYLELLAYPYGAFKKDQKEELAKVLQTSGLVGAFRIGNRRNYWSKLNPYFIERIDIRGDQSFFRNILKFYGLSI